MSFPSGGTSIGCTLYLVFLACSLHAERARDWGMVFEGTPGSGNAITDVEGVWVGHCTLVSEEGKGDHGPVAVRTGVTAILPREEESPSPLSAQQRDHGHPSPLRRPRCSAPPTLLPHP